MVGIAARASVRARITRVGPASTKQLSPIRTNRWPPKKVTYSHNITYVRPSVACPPPAVRAAAAQVAAAVSTTKFPAFSCSGCGETTHRRAECTFLSHVCGGCERVGHLEAVCRKSEPHLTPKWFMDKVGRGDAVSQPLPHARESERVLPRQGWPFGGALGAESAATARVVKNITRRRLPLAITGPYHQ